MRSSIACARCRRSKIKCVNAGIDTTCRACESSKRECVYPTPAIGVGATKRDITATIDAGAGTDDRNGEWDSPKRQRSRKATGPSGASLKDTTKVNVDILDSSILTMKVWENLFDIFQSHFATVLPFLPPTTFLNQIRQLSVSQPDGLPIEQHTSQSPVPKPEPSPLILLGVLALTARFCPPLVTYHSPSAPGNPSNPLVASEFYASALRNRLAGVDSFGPTAPDLTRVQALLMLALHEWGSCRGKSAWVYVGLAIRLSQAMGLPYELENEGATREEPSRSLAVKGEADHPTLLRRKDHRELTSDDVILEEVKRRTFWSCFLMDRCLSSGKYRPRMIRVRDLEIQLPSDNAFAFGERVRTSRLGDPSRRRPASSDAQNMHIPSLRQSVGYGDDKLRANGSLDGKSWSPVSQRNDHDIDRWEVGAEESVLSRVIRIIRIWGSIAKWACVGSRRNEPSAPWQPESRFTQLRSKLIEFQDSLPRNLQYSQRNTDTRVMYKHNFESYIVMHMVHFLSIIVLHRVYIPFLPLRCNEPIGPFDYQTLSREKYVPPDGFWRDSAKELFKAARQMMDLVITCQEREVLVEMPLAGFAIYNAALIGIYATHFSHMDPDGSLSARMSPNEMCAPNHGQGHALTRKSLDILRDMRPRLPLAVGWFRTLNRLHNYFVKVKRDSRKNMRRMDMNLPADGPDGPPSALRPLREGGLPYGTDELKLLEKLFLDFGSIEDQVSVSDRTGPETDANGQGTVVSDAGSNPIKIESMDGAAGDQQADSLAARRESWVSVNTNPPNPPGLPGGLDGERQRSEVDRRPSLPLPNSRSVQSPSPYALPSLQHHIPVTLATTSAPSFPSLPSPGPYNSPSSSQAPSHYLPATSNRLQPLGSWVGSHPQQPPPPQYSQSLPSITASPSHGSTMLPPPGSGTFGLPPALLAYDESSHPLSSVSLGGDDVVTFLDGGSYEQWLSLSDSEVGNPTGWLSAIWSQL